MRMTAVLAAACLVIGMSVVSESDASMKSDVNIVSEPQDPALAQNAAGENTQLSSSQTAVDTRQNQTDKLQEIVVTAEKRSERLQDVPVPVTVLSGDTLVENNQLRLQDWYTSVPGLIVSPNAVANNQTISIRGLTTGIGNPTVGISIDGIPYGSSSLFGGLAVPDIDPGDLARVEVLRGPQGTLYGQNSLGGLINFITIDPSTQEVSGHVQAGLSSVQNADKPGYNVRGSVNVPLGDSWAMRASAFTNTIPGYIDDPVRGMDGINTLTTNGGRLALLGMPSDTLSLKLSALYQKTEQAGLGLVHVDSGLGQYDTDFILNTPNWYEIQNYSAILTAKLGPATLTSLTGYNIQSFETNSDASNSSVGALMPVFFGVAGGSQINGSTTRKISQEFQLATPLGEKLDLLVGGYYTQEDSQWLVNFAAINPANQQTVGYLLQSTIPTFYREYAAFTDLTYKITDRIDVQGGVRYTKFSQDASETDVGAIYNTLFFNPPRTNPYTSPEATTDSDKVTYLLTPRFKITPDLMVYARFATGYSVGGTNGGVFPPAPSSYSPDETRNYELGVKGSFLDHTLSLAVSAYHIDWKNIQLFEEAPGSTQNFTGNGGDAKSQGLEIELEAKPAEGLKIAGWVAYDNAVLTQNLPSTSLAVGLDGDKLPYSAPLTGKLDLEQTFPLMSGIKAFVGGAATYTDKRLTQFPFIGAGPRLALPAYTQADLRTGVLFGSWKVDLFVNNLTNEHGFLSRNGPDNNYIILTQPRTVGLTVAKSF